MNRITLILIVALSLFASACSTTRKTATTDYQTEAQLTAATEQQSHSENTGKNAIITNVQTEEKKKVVIDFATVEFYPGGVPSSTSDSTRAVDWLNAIVSGSSNEDGEKAKPPNVKSITTGRAAINGEKTENRATEATAETKASEDTEIKSDVQTNQKEAAETKTDEKPKLTFWDWLYTAVVGGFAIYAIIIGVKTARKMHKAAKGNA